RCCHGWRPPPVPAQAPSRLSLPGSPFVKQERVLLSMGPSRLGVAVGSLGEALAEDDLPRALAVYVAHDALVQLVAEQLRQPVGEGCGDGGRDPELRFLLLGDGPGAVLNVDAEPAVVRSRVGAATVPETDVEDHHAAGFHFERPNLDTGQRLRTGNRLPV